MTLERLRAEDTRVGSRADTGTVAGAGAIVLQLGLVCERQGAIPHEERAAEARCAVVWITRCPNSQRSEI